MKPLLLAQHAGELRPGWRVLWSADGNAWIWVTVGLVALTLLVILYRFERRLVSAWVGRFLLGLRLLAATALVAALFEPVAEHRYSENVRGKVVLGVDLSESMETIDTTQSGSERDAITTVLGLEEGGSLALTRRDVVRRLLDGPWLAKLAELAEIDVVGFADQALLDAQPAALAEMLRERTERTDMARRRTDWRPVLERALETPEDVPILGVILLSDGRQNASSSGDADALASRLAAREIPVSSVLVGSTVPPRDAAIVSVRAPDRVVNGDEADIDVTVKIDGEVPGTALRVTLEREGAAPVVKSVQAPADGSRPTVAFRVPVDRVGVQPLKVRIGPMADDTRPDNDWRDVVIEASDDTSRALLIEAESRWEFRYLRSVLARDPHVRADSVVFRPPPTGDFASPTYERDLPELPSEGIDPINAYDIIFVGDVGASDVSASFWKRLESYVDRRGGTLVLSAGQRAQESWPRDEIASRLLPVLECVAARIDARAIDATRAALPFGVMLEPAAEPQSDGWPMIRLAAEPDRSREVWSALPRLPWALGSALKPSATSLVRASEGSLDAGKASVIAAMPYGLGQVFWVGTDATWRWRYRAGEAHHQRFWGQVVRWASTGRLSTGNALVRFGPARPRAPEGEGFWIKARFAEDAKGVGPETLVAARVFRAKPRELGAGATAVAPEPDGSPVAVVALRPSTTHPRLFEAMAPGLREGLYAVTLEIPGRGDVPTGAAALEVTAEDNSERIDLSAARAPLERLAQMTGGALHTTADALALIDGLKTRVKPRIRVEASPLWDRPLALLVFFGLLTVEWGVRKRVGLP